jgi:nickel-dependent lactate racemase
MIGNPLSTWGIAAGNPIWEEAREAALMTGPGFLLNVTLDRDKQITGIFAGELCAAHDAGIAFVRERNMAAVDEPFDIVLTTNSGYPLDMNLYQTVKGISAAEPIVRAGGAIIMASSCEEGIPEHGLFGSLLRGATSPAELYAQVMAFTEPKQDQWMAQIQARIQQKADVYLYTDGLTDAQIRDSLLTPCHDIPALVAALLRRYGPQARIGVLPDGPQTIAFVRDRVLP